MSEEELSSLKELYDDLWNDAKNLIKDMQKSISLYKYSSFLLLGLNFFPVWNLLLWIFVIPRSLINDNIVFSFLLYTLAIILLTFFGFKLLLTYLKLKKRYSKLWKMRSQLED